MWFWSQKQSDFDRNGEVDVEEPEYTDNGNDKQQNRNRLTEFLRPTTSNSGTSRA